MICVVSSSPGISGAEIVLKDHILSSKHHYILMVPRKKVVMDFFGNVPQIRRVYYLPSSMESGRSRLVSRPRNIGVVVREALFIAGLIRSGELNDASVIYASNSISCMSLGLVRQFRGDKQYLLHIHDMMSACPFAPVIERLCRKMDVVTVSQKCKAELVDVAGFSAESIRVIYNGVSGTDFRPKPLDTRRERIRLGFAGNISKRKGVLELAQAFRRLCEDPDGTDIELRISYHLKDERYFSAVERVLSTVPHTFESNTREQMSDFYNSVDVLVVPSIRDPLPTTVLEGMACGLIVIGSNTDGIPEMLPDEYLFEPGNVESIYRKLRWVGENLSELQVRCRKDNPEVVATEFSKEKKVQLMDGLFDRYEQEENSR